MILLQKPNLLYKIYISPFPSSHSPSVPFPSSSSSPCLLLLPVSFSSLLFLLSLSPPPPPLLLSLLLLLPVSSPSPPPFPPPPPPLPPPSISGLLLLLRRDHGLVQALEELSTPKEGAHTHICLFAKGPLTYCRHSVKTTITPSKDNEFVSLS